MTYFNYTSQFCVIVVNLFKTRTVCRNAINILFIIKTNLFKFRPSLDIHDFLRLKKKMNKLPKHTYPYVKHKQAQKPNEQNKQAKASTGGIKTRLENSEQLSYLHKCRVQCYNHLEYSLQFLKKLNMAFLRLRNSALIYGPREMSVCGQKGYIRMCGEIS